MTGPRLSQIHPSGASNGYVPKLVGGIWVAADPATLDGLIAESIGDAKGDLITFTAADSPTRLAVGTDGQVLQADSAQAAGVKWATLSALSDPTTTAGDLIRRNAANTALERLGVGTAGQVLTMVSGMPAWAAAATSGYPKTAKADATATNPATTSTSYTSIDTACDVTIAAAAGDKLFIAPMARWNQSVNVCFMDAVTVVSGVVTNYCSGHGSTGNGVAAWISPGNNQRSPLGQGIIYTVVSGDVSGGNVIIRLVFRANTAGQNNSMARDSGAKITNQVINQGSG